MRKPFLPILFILILLGTDAVNAGLRCRLFARRHVGRHAACRPICGPCVQRCYRVHCKFLAKCWENHWDDPSRYRKCVAFANKVLGMCLARCAKAEYGPCEAHCKAVYDAIVEDCNLMEEPEKTMCLEDAVSWRDTCEQDCIENPDPPPIARCK